MTTQSDEYLQYRTWLEEDLKGKDDLNPQEMLSIGTVAAMNRRGKVDPADTLNYIEYLIGFSGADR